MNSEELKSEISSFPEDCRVAICMHDNPDPDAIGSAMGLRRIIRHFKPSAKVSLIYGGEISHPQNKTMINVLDVNLISYNEIEEAECENVEQFADYFMCVDVAPERCRPKTEYIFCLDHHKVDTKLAKIKDIRSVGACASLIYDYMKYFDIELDKHDENDAIIATALLLGIKTDTQECVTENVTDLDLEAYAYYQPRVSHRLLSSIVNYSIPPYYLDLRKNLDIEDNLYLENGVFVGGLGYVAPSKRDVLPSLAEERARVEGVDTAFVFAIVGKNIEVSVRSSSYSVDVNSLCQTTFGKEFAGGKTGAGAARIPMNFLAIDDAPDEIKGKVWEAVRDFMKFKITKQISEHR